MICAWTPHVSTHGFTQPYPPLSFLRPQASIPRHLRYLYQTTVPNILHGCSHSPPTAALSRHPHALALMPAHTSCRTPQASTPPCVCSPFPVHVHQSHSLWAPSQHIAVPPSPRVASPHPHLRHYRLQFAYSDTSACPNAPALRAYNAAFSIRDHNEARYPVQLISALVDTHLYTEAGRPVQCIP